MLHTQRLPHTDNEDACDTESLVECTYLLHETRTWSSYDE